MNTTSNDERTDGSTSAPYNQARENPEPADGQEVGSVKFLPAGIDAGSWLWSLWLTHAGPTFNRPTRGTTPTRLR